MKRRNLEFEEIEYLVLISTIAACAILDVYVTFISGEEKVYTHFFYIPIILAGMWYYRKGEGGLHRNISRCFSCTYDSLRHVFWHRNS